MNAAIVTPRRASFRPGATKSAAATPCPFSTRAANVSITYELIAGGSLVTSINPVADYCVEGEIAVVTIDSPPVNALSRDVREGLKLGVEKAEADPAVKA